MSLLFGYASDLEVVQEDVDMDGNRIVDLLEPGEQKYVDHEITKTMLLNNMDFYNDVCDRRFDIRLFEQSFRKRKWCPLQVIGFLAFGRVVKDVNVTGLLARWVPNYRAQFWWYVIGLKTI